MTLPLQHTASTLIQASLSPVFLLTAVAATLSVVDTRQNRIVDRARMLESHLRAGTVDKAEAEAEIAFYVERAREIGWAAACCTMAGMCVALSVVILFIDAQVTVELTPVVEAAFTAAVLLYVASLVFYLRDVFRVTRGIRFVQDRLSITERGRK